MEDSLLKAAPFFSVVITTYNRATLLKRAMQSLIAQTISDWEAIIIDDGSTDNTDIFILPLIQQFPQIKYFFQKSGGATFAKNRGIEYARGQFITFLDSDDEYEKEHLERRKSILLQNPQISFLYGGVKVIGNPFVPDRFDYNKNIHLSECSVGGTFFIKSSLLKQKVEFKDIPLGSDADFFENIKASGYLIHKTEYPSYVYHRETANSITNNLAQLAMG